jgi:HK97 family phage major capsid protein
MPPTATEELTLPDNLDTAQRMLSDVQEIQKWLKAGRFVDLQRRFNELDRPALPQQIADILDAREAQTGVIEDRVTNAMDRWMKDHGAAGGNIRRPDVGGNEHVPVVRNEYARKIEALGFTNFGDFAKEIWHKNTAAERMPEINKIMNAFSSTEPSLGGVLIPETLDTEIRSLTLEESLVRARATVVTMATPTMLFPYVDWTTNVGSTFGGWTVTRVPEGGTITPSTAKFGRTKLSVTKQVAAAEIPNEMFADVGALDGFIRETLPRSMAYAEDTDYLTGDGAGGPLGVLNAANTALLTIAKETGQVAATVDVNNILKIYSRMLPTSKGRAVWLVNPTDFRELETLTIAVGTGGAPIMLMDLHSAPTPTMLGRPVIETEKVPALGSAGDISLIDFTYYLIGDRPGSGLESSPHVQFLNDVTTMKLTARNDGRPWIPSVFTPANGDTLSPFVTLGARA